jgi:hypothetical protein
MMHIVLASLLLLGCSKENEHALRQARESAAYIEKELAPTVVNERIAYFTKSPNDDVTKRAFPVLRANGVCNGKKINVMYNPYRDLLQVSFEALDSMAHHLETVSLEGTTVWTNPKKLERHRYLLDGTNVPRDPATRGPEPITLANLTKTYPKLFVPDQPAVVTVTAKATGTRNIGADRFEYVKVQHPGWRIKLHVFSPEMAQRIDTHTKGLAAPHATLYVISRFRERVTELRSIDDPAVKRAVKRFDELAVPAQAAADKLAVRPFEQHLSSLSVEPTQQCN